MKIVLHPFPARQAHRFAFKLHRFTVRCEPSLDPLFETRKRLLEAIGPDHESPHVFSRFSRSEHVCESVVVRREHVARKDQPMVMPERDGERNMIGGLSHEMLQVEAACRCAQRPSGTAAAQATAGHHAPTTMSAIASTNGINASKRPTIRPSLAAGAPG